MNKLEQIKILEIAIKASVEAGSEILKIYNRNDFDIEIKGDNSPLTLADKKSHDIISQHLSESDYPVLSEEGKSIPFEVRSQWTVFWIVDPLDGTKEFIKRNGEFTVNIALIKDGQPILGVIYIPVQKTLYYASESLGSFKVKNISSSGNFRMNFEDSPDVEKLPDKNQNQVYTIVGSKSHMTPETEDFIHAIENKHGEIAVLSRGSSLKICLVAEGKANIYPRFAPTMEWDIAAGHAIAKFAGKNVYTHDTRQELTYNSKSLVNPWFIVE